MKAAQITTLDGPTAIEIVDVLRPRPGAGDVLIAVRAAGVSFPDLLQTRGQYQDEPLLPYVPGAEVAGEIISAPMGSEFTQGDRVIAFTLRGGYAEQAIADVGLTFPLPANVTFEQGAALGLNYLTSHFALVERGLLGSGESVLVHGAAGGVGTAAIQIARAFGAGRVVGVVSSETKGAVALDAGADQFVLVDGFRASVIAQGRVDIVVDPVGGDRFTDSLRCLADDGRLLVIGFTAREIPTVQANRLLLNNVSVVGVGWGAYILKRPGYAARQWAELLPHIESGVLRPVVGSAYPLEEAASALVELEERRATGKVVLSLPGGSIA